jgi:hypothetical protein
MVVMEHRAEEAEEGKQLTVTLLCFRPQQPAQLPLRPLTLLLLCSPQPLVSEPSPAAQSCECVCFRFAHNRVNMTIANTPKANSPTPHGSTHTLDCTPSTARLRSTLLGLTPSTTGDSPASSWLPPPARTQQHQHSFHGQRGAPRPAPTVVEPQRAPSAEEQVSHLLRALALVCVACVACVRAHVQASAHAIERHACANVRSNSTADPLSRVPIDCLMTRRTAHSRLVAPTMCPDHPSTHSR